MIQQHRVVSPTMRCRNPILKFMLVVALTSIDASCALAQEVWEYSPYRVKIWLSVSPSLSLSEESQSEIYRKIAECAEINFGPTWSVQVESTPDALYGSVLSRLDELTVEQLLARELLLIVGKSDEAKQAFLKMNPMPPPPVTNPNAPPKKLTKEEKENLTDLEARAASLQSVRTLDTAIARMKLIAIQPLQYSALHRDIEPFLKNEQWVRFKQIIQPFVGSNEELQKQLASGETLAALVQKMDLEKFKKVARQIPARLPWQPEALLRDNDKVFLASVDRNGECIRIQVKELDSFVRRMSEIASRDVIFKYEIPKAVADLAREAFSPMVRIEETDFKTAVLRVKAAGLLTKEEHPIRIFPGDVLMPFVRRDDSNGNPTMLQSIPFTFVAATEKIDSVSKMYGAIFTASRGSLSGAMNRRTQRVGLRLSPRHPDSSLKLAVQRQAGSVVAGAEIYRRTPGDNDLHLVGRTDWRGVLPVGITDLPTIQYDPPEESKTVAIASARKVSLAPVNPPEYRIPETPVSPLARNATDAASVDDAPVDTVNKSNGQGSDSKNEASDGDVTTEKNVKPSSEQPTDAPAPPPKKPKGFIKVNVPLYLYYVKNGDTLLARLPIVNGIVSIVQADLPDDRRRLETEAFLTGLEGEVLDLVIRRKILESRIRQEIKKKDLVKANKLLDELKRVKSFEKMSEQIEGIQRRALSTQTATILPGAKKRIEAMLDTTRQLAQKYLQDTLVRTLENEIINAK